MSVRFGKLPWWAKRETTRARRDGGQLQTIMFQHSLSVSDGIAYYDGQLVIDDNEPEPKEETVKLSALPAWAKKEVQKARVPSLLAHFVKTNVQISMGKDHLLIQGGNAFFNGKRIDSD